MSKSASKSNILIPVCVCDECGRERQAFGFTNLVIGDGLLARSICSECYNLKAAKRMGILPPEISDIEPMAFFDSMGREHHFCFRVHLSTGLGITAHEVNEQGEHCGYQFSVMQHPATPTPEAFTKLVEKIKAGLSVRYLRTSDFNDSSQNRFSIKDDAIVGRIEENENGPTVVIDGHEFTWVELGQFVSSHMGFNFRLECVDPYEDIDFSSKVVRPELLWWLERPARDESDNEYQ